jgi:hypothetical protein
MTATLSERDSPPVGGTWLRPAVVLLLAVVLLFAHGCHGGEHEDTELLGGLVTRM